MCRVLIAACALLVGACAVSAPPPVTPLDASRSNVALADLQSGRTLLVRKCGGCHRTPLPAEHGAREWPKMLGEMAQRSNLDGPQRQLIEAYLVTMATH